MNYVGHILSFSLPTLCFLPCRDHCRCLVNSCLKQSMAMSCGVGRRRSLDPMLLWLWCRLVATAPIGPLAWEPPYAAGSALEKTGKKKKS